MSFIPKFDETAGFYVVLDDKGNIFYREMNGKRFTSNPVRLGCLKEIDGVIHPVFDVWDEHSSLMDDRDNLDGQLKAAQSILKDTLKKHGLEQGADFEKFYKDAAKKLHPDTSGSESTAEMQDLNADRDSVKALNKKIVDLGKKLEATEKKINTHPVTPLTKLSGKVIEFVFKMISKASFKQKIETCVFSGKARFTNYVTIEHFLESEAKALVKRQNDALEAQGAETGYLDIETARERIRRRYSFAAKHLAKV